MEFAWSDEAATLIAGAGEFGRKLEAEPNPLV